MTPPQRITFVREGHCPNVIQLRNLVILSERSESKNLPIYGLQNRNFRAKILRLRFA